MEIESESGIDVNHLLRYYSRLRFVSNLLPLLENGHEPRVMSILAGGKEGNVQTDNLDLCKEFSFSASNTYPATMTSVAFEFLAQQNQTISFIHEFPGLVTTPLFKNSSGGLLGGILSVLMRPIAMSPAESGDWNDFLSTSPSFPAKNHTVVEQSVRITPASTGVVGGGSYILNYNGQDATNKELMAGLRENNLPETVWKHTLSTFDRIISSEAS
jgi:hypothetical protein